MYASRALCRGCLLVLLLAAANRLAAAEDLARWDWYFRESLAAIRDWEDLLARWERESPAFGVPVLPVPGDPDGAVWPNPIPRRLLPPEQRDAQVRVRPQAGRLILERSAAGSQAKQEEIAADREVLGCQHPGGGGKDQWYHAYQRRFDRLLRFQPKPARFVVRPAAPLDLQRGATELTLQLHNCSDQPLVIRVRAEFRRPQQTQELGEQSVSLPAGAAQECRIPLQLDAPGGGLVVITFEDGDQRYWLPVLTHVEQTAPILDGIAKILADHPDSNGAAELARLERETRAWNVDRESVHGLTWRELFEQASALRDRLLLGRLDFDTLLFVKRKPFFSEQPFMDAHHLFNRPGGGIFRLSPVRPDGNVTAVADSLGAGVYRDLCLHWDARRLLFAFGNGSDDWDGSPSYHLYEIGIGGEGLRQLTAGPKNDCEPFYLPDGRIGFTSDRSEHFVMCGGDRHAPNLFACDPRSGTVQRLSHNVFNDFNPTVLPDGRILYGRWEYNERSVTSLHNPFTMHPDGTMVSPYYGNATIRPNVVMFPRPVPGSRQVMALFTAHHGQTHGPVGLIDVRRGIDGDAPLTLLTPGVPISGEKVDDSRAGWFSDPQPLSEDTWLCSYTPTVLPWLETSWGLYVGDRHGNLGLVYRDPAIACAEPVPVVARPVPHVLPMAAAESESPEAEASLVMTDVYQGLTGVPHGAARYLRILEDVPRVGVHRGGVVCTSGTLIFTIKRVLGTVPIEPDGSAYFTVPADRNVYFAVLDAERREIQRMRSVVCLRPQERRSCIGCHEARNRAPSAVPVAALRREPSRPVPPPWGTRTISYLRDVQPVLDAHCVRCHAYDRPNQGVILTGDLTDQFCVSYEELLPYLSVAISNRWDHPDDVYARPPYTYGSQVSELTRLLDGGHHGVQLSAEERERLLTWIDANGVYYDRYESEHFPQRRIFAGAISKQAGDVFQRRCTACHGADDGRQDTWWLTLNRRDVRASRMLAAPLAAAAGGWGRCEGPVFADSGDADYQALLALLMELRRTLDAHPREDLLSLRGSPAENQRVALPPPPPPGPAADQEPGDGWIDLLRLPWTTGRAGWTPNNDGQPRKNRDVTGQPLRLGGRRYTKGLGTHAPSEITYSLDGRYARFACLVGGAERGGTVVFQVFADDRQLFDSGTLQGLGKAVQVDVPLAGAKTLRLVVTDAGDNYFHDMANWANPRLLCPDK